MKTSSAVLCTAYVGSIVAAAAAVEYIGPVPVWPGIVAPAGVYVIGLTMVFRDLVQDKIGPGLTYALMLLGAVLSAAISPTLALAAGFAFLLSETLDMLVYTPIRKHTLVGAILASNAVGILADSYLFLTLAFGNLDYFTGQVIGKAIATVFAVLVLLLIHHFRPARTPK